jgi:hypothetical protein
MQAHLSGAACRMLERIREFDACFEEAGGGLGFRSSAHWLSWRLGIGLGTARDQIRVARALEKLPAIAAAMERGALSYSKVRAASRIATPENEKRILEFALEATASDLERLVQVWRRTDRVDRVRSDHSLETEGERDARRRERRELSIRVDLDGSYVVTGRLEPEVGALLRRAVEAASQALYRSKEGDLPETPRTSRGQRWADAIGLVARVALQGGEAAVNGEGDLADGEDGPAEAEGDPARGERPNGSVPALARTLRTLGRGDRFQVVVHVDAEVLGGAPARAGEAPLGTGARYGDGRCWLGEERVGVSAETARRLSCDAARLLMTHDADGSVLDVGRRSRVVTAPIRRALEYRDGGCRFPGCGLRICEPHHIHQWAHGGETRLDNLVLLCPRHHRAVHEEGWGVRMESGRRPRFFAPDGREVSPAPSLPPALPEAVGGLLRTQCVPGAPTEVWCTPAPAPAAAAPGWRPPMELSQALSSLRD